MNELDHDWLDLDGDTPTQSYHMGNRDLMKRDAQFKDMGYREGLEAGKLSELQAGFDEGYNRVGAPVGLSFGKLRGEVDALVAITMSKKERTNMEEQALRDLQSLSLTLKDVKLEDLVEPDWEAYKHDLEHKEGCNVEEELNKRQLEWAARPDRLQLLRQQFNEFADFMT